MNSKKFKGRLSDIIGCGAYGEDLFIITLASPNTQFCARLDIPVIRSGTNDQYAPPGTGMYTVSEDRQALIPFPAHPDSSNLPINAIYIKNYVGAEEKIAAFEDSALDLVVNDPNGMSNLGYGNANVISYFQTTNMHYLGFNTKSKFFSQAALRHAMTYLINREYVTTNLMGGCGVNATLPISPVSSLYNPLIAARYEFAPEKCITVFRNNGVQDFDDDGSLEQMITGIPVEIKINFIVNSESAVKVTAARDMAERMRNLGIDVTLRELAWSDFTAALRDGDFDIYYAETKLTADFNLSALILPEGALNYGKYNNAACAAAISDYLTSDELTRAMYADLMCQYIMEDAPIIPIAFEKQQLITHRNVTMGMSPTQGNVFSNFTNWTINIMG
jgi:peptide/nickel transport system substrate-binding protein